MLMYHIGRAGHGQGTGHAGRGNQKIVATKKVKKKKKVPEFPIISSPRLAHINYTVYTRVKNYKNTSSVRHAH